MNELLLNYMEYKSGPLWSAKRSTELNVWLGWVGAKLSLDSPKQKVFSMTNSTGWFLITCKDCVQQGVHDDVEAPTPG